MEKYVITHHAHHPDEGSNGVYHLIYAEEITYISNEKEVTTHKNHQDIVWDAGDTRWRDKLPEDIANEQRKIVKEAIEKQKNQSKGKISKANHLGTAGQEL